MQSMGLLWPPFIPLIKCGWWYFLKRPVLIFHGFCQHFWLTFLLPTQELVSFPVISAFKVLAKSGSSQPPFYCSRVLIQNTLPLPYCQFTVFTECVPLFPRALNLIALIYFILDESGIGPLILEVHLEVSYKTNKGQPANTVNSKFTAH